MKGPSNGREFSQPRKMEVLTRSSSVYAGDPAKKSMKAAFGRGWKLEETGGSIISGTLKLIQGRKKNLPSPQDPRLPTVKVDAGLRDELVLGDPNAPEFVLWNEKLRQVLANNDFAFLSSSLHSKFISFDDITSDPFAIFGESQYDDLIGLPSLTASAPSCPLEGGSLPSLSFLPHTQFMSSESYVDFEPEAQHEIGDCTIPALENMASTSAGPESFFASNQLDWGMLQEGICSHHTNIVQQSASQCDNCQLLRCIIHSNGVQDTKIEIHGCDGQNYHVAAIENFYELIRKREEEYQRREEELKVKLNKQEEKHKTAQLEKQQKRASLYQECKREVVVTRLKLFLHKDDTQKQNCDNIDHNTCLSGSFKRQTCPPKSAMKNSS